MRILSNPEILNRGRNRLDLTWDTDTSPEFSGWNTTCLGQMSSVYRWLKIGFGRNDYAGGSTTHMLFLLQQLYCYHSNQRVLATARAQHLCGAGSKKTLEAIRMHTTQHGLDACSDMVWTYAHAFGSLTIESSNTLAYMLAEAD